ncbi:Fe-S oxidoreductase [Sphingobium sp. AN641]|uniref:Fe-S oxidoreductase n=1 Tax=Sphingobium sp. AN641 TaxID=3133443 RepID=UPI0030C31FC4
MRTIMLTGLAALTLALAGGATAQTTSDPTMQPPGTETPSAPDNVPAPTDQPGMGTDPNAGVPTGAVPADSGMAPAPAGAPADPTAPVGSSSNPVTVGGNMTPPPAEAKDYPLCSRTVQDSCINPGEAKRRPRR